MMKHRTTEPMPVVTHCDRKLLTYFVQLF